MSDPFFFAVREFFTNSGQRLTRVVPAQQDGNLPRIPQCMYLFVRPPMVEFETASKIDEGQQKIKKSSAPTDNQIFRVPANQFSPSPGTSLVPANQFSPTSAGLSQFQIDSLTGDSL